MIHNFADMSRTACCRLKAEKNSCALYFANFATSATSRKSQPSRIFEWALLYTIWHAMF